jgi:hypothetical protein
MKKIVSSLILTMSAFAMIGQTIVNTSAEDKKVVLEEFTGIHCVFCPQGHVIAQAIQNNNPGNAFLINIHTGSFATPGNGEPDFRTSYGSSIAGQTGLTGYPSGTVNRHNFPGQEMGNSGTTALSRNQWTNTANQILDIGSYVNVGIEADIDVSTNEIVIHVEAYYTGNSPQGTNFLNVALLQNNTLGPQTGGNMDDEYVHMHRLVEMITGLWGVEITNTTTGSFIDETYTYPIPADYNGVPAEIADLEVVAYISETRQEIPSGSGAYPTYSGFANANDAEARYVDEIADQCGFDFSPKVNIQNVGSDEITALTIDYSVNGGASQSFDWTGSLTSLEHETIELPSISYTIETVNTVTVTIQNDDDNSNNTIEGNFNNAQEVTTTVNMILNTDIGSQCTWEVINSGGNVIYSGGPYENFENIQETFDLPEDCYIFSIYDSGGNGGGSIVLFDSESNVIISSSGDYEAGTSAYFNTDDFLSSSDNALQNLNIYPNPTSSILNVSNAQNANIEVYDVLGKLILSRTNISFDEKINVSKLQSGTYFMKLSKDNQVSTEKFIVKN